MDSEQSNYKVKRQSDVHMQQGNIQEIHTLLMKQITRCEQLQQEVVLLQKTIHRYETVLSEVDAAHKKPLTNTELEFKKIIASLTKQLGQPKAPQQKQERDPQLKQANDELLQERQTFI